MCALPLGVVREYACGRHGAARGSAPLEILACAAALALAWAGVGTAQVLSLGGFGGDASFGLQFESEDISGGGQPDRSLDRLYFEERVGVRTRGAFFDPGLARFHAGVELGLFQDQVDTESGGISASRSGDGRLLGYDVRLGMLGARPYSFDLFGRRGESTSRRDFGGRTRTDAETLGATVRLLRLPLPSTVSFEQQDVRQRFTLLPRGLQRDETRRIATYYGERRGEASMLRVDYRFDDVFDRARPRGEFQVHSAGASHFLRFGSYGDQRLGSSVRFFRREGEQLATSTLLARETLALRHSKSLSSNYSYAFSFFDIPGSQRMTHSGLASLHHTYYESLGTGVNANATYADLSPGRDFTYGAGLGVGYRKRIPLRGLLLSGVGVAYQITDRRVPQGRLSVFQEVHAFPDAEPVFLDNPDVIESTIVVTDEQGVTVFAPGIDYFVERVGRRTQLRRNVFGGIEAGQTILVSYDFGVQQSLKLASRPLNFNAGLDFGWIYFFYFGERLRQRALRGDIAEVLGPVDSDTAGVELRWAYERWSANLLQEYSRYDAVDVRFQGVNLTQSAVMRAHRRLQIGMTAIEGFFTFRLPERSRDFYAARLNASWQPRNRLFVDGFAGVRRQRETTVPTEELVEFGARWRWSIGLFTLILAYDHDVQDIGLVSRTGDLVTFRVARSS